MTTPLTLTQAAADRIDWIAKRQKKPAILRLSVEGGGCSGFQYKFDLDDAPEADDSVSETAGVQLVVDPVSLELLAGSTVDYVESLGGAAFLLAADIAVRVVMPDRDLKLGVVTAILGAPFFPWLLISLRRRTA